MADPNVVALQKEINRFANDPDIGFSPIACDGSVGPQTLAGALYALTSVGSDAAPTSADVKSHASDLINALNTPADITNNLYDLTTTIQSGAEQIRLFAVFQPSMFDPVYIDCPASAPSQQTLPTPKTSTAKQLIDQYKQAKSGLSTSFLGLPSWALWGGGAVLAFVGVVMVRDRLRKR